MMTQRQVGRDRQARIKLQYAGVYPGIQAGEWMPAWLLVERLLELAQRSGRPPGGRVCDPAHCEFRGGGPRSPEFRDLRTRTVDAP
ncbi:MAG TPA: hypothetical protein VMN37_00690 [Gemmatimonadales bacterium]|nr:hypothetical protein [Gemmatimonadales bacterium]